ncbi:GAF domain-containing protein [Cellulomonas sp. NPDC055163]
MHGNGPAWPAGSDPSVLTASLRTAHETFVTTGTLPRGIRTVVADSWVRSARSGVDPESPAPTVDLTDAELVAHRRNHPLGAALPIVRRLLVEGGVGEGIVAALTDENGRLLWVDGDPAVRRQLDGVGFVEGASWGEEQTGTNAPGTALATRSPVQVFAAEHFTRSVHPWSCTAAPVRDPSTGRVLGVLDVTGREHLASPLVLRLVTATVMAVELELAAARAAEGAPPRRFRERGATSVRPPELARLDVLGTAGGVLRLGVEAAALGAGAEGGAVRLDGAGAWAAAGRGNHRAADGGHQLSLRHAEMLLLLATHPRGLSVDELAVLLHPGDLSDVTVRAEVSRLRRVVGPLLGPSRPYRLAAPVTTDVHDVRRALARGDLLGALAQYVGPVLPRSVAPGVEQLRDELCAELRSAVLASSDAVAVERWVATDEGTEDWHAWQHLMSLCTTGSPPWVRARGRLERLGRSFGHGVRRPAR